MSTNEAPPVYDFTSGAHPAEKGKASSPTAFASTSGASTSGPGPHSRAVDDGGAPTSFHFYKAGMFKNNDRVTGEDKDTTLYFLAFPVKWKGGWDIVLHSGAGKDGPVAATISREGLMSTTIKFAMANGWTTILSRKEYFSTTFHFAGHAEGSLYEWKKSGGMLATNWVCTNLSNEDVVATWRQATWATKKLGQLRISQHYKDDAELILATAIAVEETMREQTGTIVAIS